MLIISVVCDLGVRGILHECTFKPLDELTLEATEVSAINLQTHMLAALYGVRG